MFTVYSRYVCKKIEIRKGQIKCKKYINETILYPLIFTLHFTPLHMSIILSAIESRTIQDNDTRIINTSNIYRIRLEILVLVEHI